MQTHAALALVQVIQAGMTSTELKTSAEISAESPSSLLLRLSHPPNPKYEGKTEWLSNKITPDIYFDS